MNQVDSSNTAKKVVTDIDDLLEPTFDERSRQKFVSVLRNHTKTTMRDELERHYRKVVAPAFLQQHARPIESGDEVENALAASVYYKMYSSIRYNAQKMMFRAVMDPVERQIYALSDFARDISRRKPAGGSLRLQPGFVVPRYVSAMDVHLVPGGFHTEYVDDDVAQGVIVAHGGRVSTAANEYRKDDLGGVGRSVGNYIARKYPDFRPRSVLDIGTQSGKNLRPYLDVFPGIEAHGVDVSGPALRYGHAKAEAAGQAIHYSQQNAENLDFPDSRFDLIVSSFFFHEIPVRATRSVLAECYRLLRPGGLMVHMELPPRSQCDPWLNFYWDWDAKHNNEPYYVSFRSQDLEVLMREAGFAPAASFTTTVPNFSTVDPARYDDMIAGAIPTPLHGRGGWFVFGAWK